MVEVFEDIEQGSEAWFQARAGIATASMFGQIVKQDGTARKSDGRKTYMMELAGEILTGEPVPGFTSFHTERGHEMEPEARELYSFITGAVPAQVGFIRNGKIGCSPDSIIDDDGLLEIKSKLPKFAVACIHSGEFPEEHKAQCQGALLVSEREWIDIAVFWPGLPLFIKRAYRDENYLSNLSTALDEFNEELAEVVEKVRAYGVAA
jgi:hypothetical protein